MHKLIDSLYFDNTRFSILGSIRGTSGIIRRACLIWNASSHWDATKQNLHLEIWPFVKVRVSFLLRHCEKFSQVTVCDVGVISRYHDHLQEAEGKVVELRVRGDHGVSAFVSVTPLEIFNETLGRLHPWGRSTHQQPCLWRWNWYL